MDYCPLCGSSNDPSGPVDYYQDKKRNYLHCRQCGLVMVPEQFHLSASAEKQIYDLHQNDVNDPGYRKFLSRTFEPLFKKLSAGATGLDFGCGPAPLISKVGKEYGFNISNYDLYYFNDAELLRAQYDFVVLTEVIEHIAEPRALLELLASLLKPGAILAIMTKRLTGIEAFKQWHYKNDPTHICFYSMQSLEWIAKNYQWQLQVIDQDVVFCLS